MNTKVVFGTKGVPILKITPNFKHILLTWVGGTDGKLIP